MAPKGKSGIQRKLTAILCADVVAEGRIEVNEYVESIDAHKANIPPEHMEEAELAIQPAGFKMDCEAVKTSEEIRACYRLAAEIAQKAIAEIRNMPLE